jgi:hypothetical protein
MDDEGREFSHTAPDFRYSAHSRAASGNGSPMMDQRVTSPAGLNNDGGVGAVPIPEALRYDVTGSWS